MAIRLIKNFRGGGKIEFGPGNFDDWCFRLTDINGKEYRPKDVKYFERIEAYGNVYGRQVLYDDFVTIYKATGKIVDPAVLDLIETLSSKYPNISGENTGFTGGPGASEMERLLTTLYAGMIAENNKKNTMLGHRVKRLGVHQILIEGCSARYAADYSRKKSGEGLDAECAAKGF